MRTGSSFGWSDSPVSITFGFRHVAETPDFVSARRIRQCSRTARSQNGEPPSFESEWRTLWFRRPGFEFDRLANAASLPDGPRSRRPSWSSVDQDMWSR